MQQVQSGRTHLFAELIMRYQPALLRVARSRLKRADWAEDAVQEAFLAAYKSRHTFQPQFSFRTWLWTILLNQCRNLYARQARAPRVHEGEAELLAGVPQGAASQPEPLEQILQLERRQLLASLLEQLPVAQADALRLRFFGGLKFQEIADTMACSLGTAKNRVQSGLMKVSDLLRQETCYQALAEDWLPRADAFEE